MSSETDVFAHRRGLMLGLTLSEILMLVLFILLLTYTVILTDKNKEIVENKEFANELEQQVADLQTQLNVGLSSMLEALGLPGFPIDDENELAVRLRSATEEISKTNATNEKLSRLVSSPEEAEELAEALDAVEFSPSVSEIVEEWIEENANFEETQSKEGPEVPESLEEALVAIDRLESQIEFHERRMLELGNGLTYPPCWSRNGKAVYIYNVDLLDDAVKVSAGDSRIGQDLSALKENGPEPRLEKPIRFSTFLDRTSGLMNWSVGAKCRFYVRIYDKTSETNKDGYLRARQTVEQHFYPYHSQN